MSSTGSEHCLSDIVGGDVFTGTAAMLVAADYVLNAFVAKSLRPSSKTIAALLQSWVIERGSDVGIRSSIGLRAGCLPNERGWCQIHIRRGSGHECGEVHGSFVRELMRRCCRRRKVFRSCSTVIPVRR